jgi:lysine-specific demethylase 3
MNTELFPATNSTRLHMDMADAINVMAHANNRADGSLGCAVWDIFRPEDADGLRQFLIDKYSATHKMQDPIHSQQFYLDSEVRRELFEKTGIYSFRIYQYPVSKSLM